MKKLICLFVALSMLFIALPAHARGGFPIKLCSDEAESTGPGSCRFLRFLPANSAGMGTLSLLPVGSAMYKWDSALSRFTPWDGAAGSVTVPGYIRVQDGDSTVLLDVVDDFADSLATSLNGQMSASVMYGYDGATLSMARIQAVDADNVLDTTLSMTSKSFLLGYEPGASQWDRLQVHAFGDSLSATQQGLDVLSHNLFYDGTNARRWQGVQVADNLTYPVAPHVVSWPMLDDGGTGDKMKSGATGSLLVELTNPASGDDAGAGLQHVGLKATTKYEPAKTTTTGIVGALTTVLGPIDVSGQRRCCVYLQNDAGDADPFVDVEILFGPNTTDMPTLGNGSWSACDALADGEVCFYCWDDAHSAFEVQVEGGAAADVDVDAWLHCTQ